MSRPSLRLSAQAGARVMRYTSHLDISSRDAHVIARDVAICRCAKHLLRLDIQLNLAPVKGKSLRRPLRLRFAFST